MRLGPKRDALTSPGAIQPFSRQAMLRDGTPVQIRLAHRDDEAKVVAAFGKLDEGVRPTTRYCSFKKEA